MERIVGQGHLAAYHRLDVNYVKDMHAETYHYWAKVSRIHIHGSSFVQNRSSCWRHHNRQLGSYGHLRDSFTHELIRLIVHCDDGDPA